MGRLDARRLRGRAGDARRFAGSRPTLRVQIAERGGSAAALRTVRGTMTALLGRGEVRGEMAAYLVEARP
ncbi:hypothetical protein LWC33_28575 [Pseudonocardia sp. RS11V-5]|uniref:hypothetical protein n=1 Tax=Pseudonocardia terrae TaxID=2905831 RepID=UPI001E339251|nr:hypothetical protein [Pseudonocardia terrae]MCE3555389.1 hypothetical protein [Pseudonocardia terrae]